MKAVIWKKYGPPEVLQLGEAEMPTLKEKQDYILVRNYAFSVNSGDWKLRKADPAIVRLAMGLTAPKQKILGMIFAGVVEQVGENVKKFKVGDKVFGMTGMKLGTYAQYFTIKESGAIALIPENVSFEEAAAIPFGGTTGLHFLKDLDIKENDSCLVYGASGAVGVIITQLLKNKKANVTAVTSSENFKLTKSLGADEQIDYKKQDVFDGSRKWKYVIECVGKVPYTKALNGLDENANGNLVLISATIPEIIKCIFKNFTRKSKIIIGVASETAEYMETLSQLLREGNLTPVIDSIYSMDQIVEAHTKAEAWHKKGAIVVKVG